MFNNMLAGSETDQVVDCYEELTDQSIPTPGSIDNLRSLLLKIHVEREVKKLTI